MLLLSHVLSEATPMYGHLSQVKVAKTMEMAQGAVATCSELVLPVHAGTHIDAPCHFDQGGKRIEDYPDDFWCCVRPTLLDYPAQPDELISLDAIGSLLETVPADADCLLVRTGFERYRAERPADRYVLHNPGWHPEIGVWLRAHRRLKFFGFDTISVTGYARQDVGVAAHRAFLAAEPEGVGAAGGGEPIVVIEDMRLSVVAGPLTRVIVAPLLYRDADGAPATVLAETAC